LIIKKKKSWAGGVEGPVVDCLPSVHEALDLFSRITEHLPLKEKPKKENKIKNQNWKLSTEYEKLLMSIIPFLLEIHTFR
jgi:hypothetical protein